MIFSLACLTSAFVLAIVGCALLALSQTKHWRAVTDRKDLPPVIAKLAGCLLILATFVPCLLSEGTSFAILMWPLLLTLAAFVVGMILTYNPCKLSLLATLLRRN